MTGVDLTLKLTPDEVAELTERILDGACSGQAAAPLVPILSLLEILEPQQVPDAVVAEAVDAVLRNRERRLSSALRAKTEDLERMLFALLGRLDTRFASQARYALPSAPSPGPGPGPHAATPATPATPATRDTSVDFAIRAEAGELEIRARLEGPSGARRLFVLVVRAARPATAWERLVSLGKTRDRAIPKRVIVIEPHGATLEELIGQALAGRGSRDAEDRALAFALETLGAVVARETDRAVDYLHTLRFEVPIGSTRPEPR